LVDDIVWELKLFYIIFLKELFDLFFAIIFIKRMELYGKFDGVINELWHYMFLYYCVCE
jgi:hypothetical protein